ncbi:MAG: ATP-dependent DNA helicase [Armatimonadetes bacterium]|nr:ATP-dependent DNA helicase [Armatimonadota bacterium]
MSETIYRAIDEAFSRLASRSGFSERPSQKQLALLLADSIIEGKSALYEAPTGLGKSLATLIPALVIAKDLGKRVVIATYTNVLAEQYWSKDLPFALDLLDDKPRTAFLLGQQRYACMIRMDQVGFDPLESKKSMGQGIESDGFKFLKKQRGSKATWTDIQFPPRCEGRFCPLYRDCFYFSARRKAQNAGVVITNHSVVIQDALLKQGREGEGSLLGSYDYLILDEAHDFPQAVINGVEIILNAGTVRSGMEAVRAIGEEFGYIANRINRGETWRKTVRSTVMGLEQVVPALETLEIPQKPTLYSCSPAELAPGTVLEQIKDSATAEVLQSVCGQIRAEVGNFHAEVSELMAGCAERGEETADEAMRVLERSSGWSLRLEQLGHAGSGLFDTSGVSSTYLVAEKSGASVRRDVIDLGPLLTELFWEKLPVAGLSATLCLDGNFDFYKKVTGWNPDFEEVLDSTFDYQSQAALYTPKVGAIPDPTLARKEGRESDYYASVANELWQIIRLLGGRTLALFPSRKEMEAVYRLMPQEAQLPILIQRYGGTHLVAKQFKSSPETSLFALRSFWTGFDAPGDTCSCVAVVRIPFEVPYDPPNLTRQAWMAREGRDPFREWALPNAKIMIRQGVGRLIRRDEDRGLIALLDPRLCTKNYGQEILDNLPSGMRRFDSAEDAIGWLGLGCEQVAD